MSYGPRLEAAFRNKKDKATTVMTAELLYGILILALQLLDGQDMGPWARHVGKGVSHHHGWLAWVQRMRLVVAAKPRWNSPKLLALGQMGRLFKLSPLDAAMSVRLEHLIAFGTHVRTVLLRPPRTFLCWRECIQALQVGMVESQMIAKGPADKYGDKWLCRSLCLFAMARAGIPQLDVIKKTSSQGMAPFLEAQGLAELSRWFPDSCNWCGIFEDAVDVAVAMKKLGYLGRPELLTMWLCIAGDPQMKTFVSDTGVCTVNGRNLSHEDFRQAAFDSKKKLHPPKPP